MRSLVRHTEDPAYVSGLQVCDDIVRELKVVAGEDARQGGRTGRGGARLDDLQPIIGRPVVY